MAKRKNKRWFLRFRLILKAASLPLIVAGILISTIQSLVTLNWKSPLLWVQVTILVLASIAWELDVVLSGIDDWSDIYDQSKNMKAEK